MKKIKFFDSTLRDGSHAVQHQISEKNITNFCNAIDGSGVYTVIIGHGNGLGASSIQMNLSLMQELDMVKVAKQNLKKARLGTFITVGFGTITDHIEPAMKLGTDVFCIASHCTEADTMGRHIKYLTQYGKEVYGVLMNIHMIDEKQLIEQAKKIESNGADGIILMDSAGASTPEQVKRKVSSLYDNVNMDIGFHAHNNLSMAVANSYEAILNGATIIDGTICGFGAGAGNCQLEALAALLQKDGRKTNLDLYKMIDAGNLIREEFNYSAGVDGISIVSGYAGVVSTFKPRVIRIAKEYDVDPRDIFVELGRRKAVAGQDDLILEVAKQLSTGNRE